MSSPSLMSSSSLLAALAACAVLSLAPRAGADAPLWQIGKPDNSGAEFTGAANPSRFAIPADWATRTAWPEWKPATAAEPWTTTIAYDLDAVPAGGAEFALKTVNASAMVPEVAVFSNGKLMGILQIIGTESPRESPVPRRFGNTYRVYIPREFLQQGANTLKLRKLPNTYALKTTNYTYLTIDFDAFTLTGLDKVPAEPVHSRTVWLGTANGGFSADQHTLDTDPLTWEWLGVAHSGNPMRAAFWSNRDNTPPVVKRTEWLQKAVEYHMAPVLDYLSDKNSAMHLPDWLDANGELLQKRKDLLDAAFAKWGSYIRFYEISNEPSMDITNASFEVEKALAAYIHRTKPAHVLLAAPGYTYTGGHGLPISWDDDEANRRAVEEYCDVTGGHSYGWRFIKPDGSVLMKTIDTEAAGPDKTIPNGFPRPVLLTEVGTVDDHHIDFKSVGVAEADLYSSCYDKNLRSNIAYADWILNFCTFGVAAGGTDHLCLLGAFDQAPADWAALPFPKSPDSEKKVSIFRRLACAYATHGAPLPYVYLDDGDVADQLVYFRAVDTSAQAPMPGNGHRPDKILLNFVNFDATAPHRMRVQVTLPAGGSYAGTKFTGADRYVDAKSDVTLSGPTVDLDETLKPGEAVQYILTKPGS